LSKSSKYIYFRASCHGGPGFKVLTRKSADLTDVFVNSSAAPGKCLEEEFKAHRYHIHVRPNLKFTAILPFGTEIIRSVNNIAD
jgi:hypothetical protein